MSRLPGHGGDQRRDAGQWVLLDARFHLLAIGSARYPGISPKTTLDQTARRILLPRMRAASVHRLPLTDLVDDVGEQWTVRVEPILGAKTGQVMALLGGYGDTQTPMPDPPLVGSWELQVTPPGPDQIMRSYWSPSLFAVHDMAVPPGPGPHALEGPQWLDEVVVESDRAETRLLQEELLGATSDALRYHAFCVHSPDTGREFRVRSAIWRDITEPGPDTWLRGLSMRMGEHERGPDSRPGATGYLEAMFAVVRDPLCAIDTAYEQLFLTSARFAELDVDLPAHRHLPHMCHQDDMPALRAMLTHAATTPGVLTGPVHVRIASKSGGWTTLELSGAGVRHRGARTGHVLCRVHPVNGATDLWPRSPPSRPGDGNAMCATAGGK